MEKLVLGTRGSPLALAQAAIVKGLIRRRFPGLEVCLEVARTRGDAEPRASLTASGGAGLFTKELEEALLEGRIHAAAHSLKDLPVEQPPGLLIAALPERDSPRDALVSVAGYSLETLPEGALVGTGSPRRRAQLLHQRPDLRFLEVRGNVETRVRKMKEGACAALVLAAAGLRRLGLGGVRVEPFPPGLMLPAPGQGALAVEARASDPETLAVLAAIDDLGIRAAVTAEREVLRILEGGCRVPIGALAEELAGGRLRLAVVVADPAGRTLLRAQAEGPLSDPAALAAAVTADLLARGAAALLTAPAAGGPR